MTGAVFYPDNVLMFSVLNSGDCANKLSVLADRTRLAVLEVLLKGPNHVTGINEELGIAQNLLSHHLRVLREAGLVTCTREGKTIVYELAGGVEAKPSRRAIDLGCCTLTFDKSAAGKKKG